MRASSSATPPRSRSRKHRASPSLRTQMSAAGAGPAAVLDILGKNRSLMPAKPLLPLLVQKSEVTARTQTGQCGHRDTRSSIPPNSSKRSGGNGGVPLYASAPGGFFAMVERGELPADYDMEPALTSDGPMRSVRAPLHAAVADRRQRQPVMTEVSGFKQMNALKLDYDEIEKLPAKLNVTELQTWEVNEAAERAQQERTDHLASSSSVGSLNRAASSTAAPPDDPMSPTALSRDDPRTYTELLDLYSMHEFIIRKGKTLRNTPEFASFKRHYAASWGGIESVIAALEGLLGAHGIDLAYIDGKKLAALAAYQFGPEAAAADLVECIANADEVEPLLGNISHQYRYGKQGHHMAAAKIQSVWRMYRQTIAYRHLLLGTRAATIIQRQWAIYRAHCITKRTIQAVRQTRVAHWKQTMAQFCSRWPRIRQGRRTVIHIPSLSHPPFHAKKVPFYMAQQLGQLTRLCDLADPKLDIIIVVPFKPGPEVLEYNYSLLEEAGITNAQRRFTLLVPEEAKRLPDGMSLTRLTLMSSRLMKMLRALATGKPAFIVPGVVGPEELLLASDLNIPLLGPDPHAAQVFGSKSGCHRLLEAANVPTPAGARQVRSRGDLLRALASLMLAHRECPRWLVKLETESGSRGHAYFDVGRMKTLKNVALFQQAVGVATAMTAVEDANVPEGNEMASATSAAFGVLLKELEDHGAKRVRLVHPSAYADWPAYLSMLDAVGACVEAVPSRPVGSVTANLFIEPSGEAHLQSVVEPLLAPAYTVMGCCCPPHSAFPHSIVEDAALRVARAAYRKRIYGYLSVDFVVFTDREAAAAAAPGEDMDTNGKRSENADHRGSAANVDTGGASSREGSSALQIWGVDVDLCWTNNAVAHQFAVMLSQRHGTAKAAQGTSAAGAPTEVRPQYVYSGLIYNPFISMIRHSPFFSLCRSRGIAYDREQRSGVVFHLVDALLCGCLGVLALGPDMSQNVKRMSAFQSVLNMELPKQGEHSSESNFAYFSAVIRQLARIITAKTDS